MDLLVISTNSKNRFLKSSAIIYLLSLSITACSGASTSTEQSGSRSTPSTKDFVQHIHPENVCLGTKSHAHAGGDKVHEHELKCAASSFLAPSNAHVHPATKHTKAFRHVHPNGANKHTHHK